MLSSLFDKSTGATTGSHSCKATGFNKAPSPQKGRESAPKGSFQSKHAAYLARSALKGSNGVRRLPLSLKLRPSGLKISCRIFSKKPFLVTEESFVQFNRETRISAERTTVQGLLGPSDVAKWLGVSAGWVRDHATRKEPRLRAVKVGKLLRFRPKDVEEFLRTSTGEVAN